MMDEDPRLPPKQSAFNCEAGRFFRKLKHRSSQGSKRKGGDEFSTSEGDANPKIKASQTDKVCVNRKPSEPGMICRCVAAASGDCAAIICCCPLTALRLLTLVVIKLPATAARKLVADIKRHAKQRRRRKSDGKFDEPEDPTLSACNSNVGSINGRSDRLSSFNWHDQEFLRDHFKCKDLGFGTFNELDDPN